MYISLRIKELIDKKKLNISTFEHEIGAGNGSIRTILNKNTNVSGDLLSKILNTYPDLNANWLITGKGSMYIKSDYPSLESDSSIVNESQSSYRACKMCADKDYIIQLQREKILMLELNLVEHERNELSFKEKK